MAKKIPGCKRRSILTPVVTFQCSENDQIKRFLWECLSLSIYLSIYVCVCVYIYIYIYIYIIWVISIYLFLPLSLLVSYIYELHTISFQTFFVRAFKIVVNSWKFSMTNFYDFRFKWTATAAIGIHSTKAWLSQLVNFKNAIWHLRRTICNKIMF